MADDHKDPEHKELTPQKPTLAYSASQDAVTKQERRRKREETRARVNKRRELVWQLRLAGATFLAIGQQTGVSEQQAFRDYKHVSEALNAVRLEKADEVRQLIVGRHERLLVGLWPKASAGDVLAAEQCIKILQEEAKIYGSYAPLKLASTTPDGTQWAPLSVALQQISGDELLVLDKLRAIRLLPPGAAQQQETLEGQVVPEPVEVRR